MDRLPSAHEIASDATWLAQAYDSASGRARLVAMSAGDYRAASFLDDRMLQEPRRSAVMPWNEVEAAVGMLQRTDARWIFHIGHVGSTLVARLLGELDDVLSVREPRILRDVASLDERDRPPFTQAVTSLCSRAFAPAERALVKTTSFVSEVAPELVPGGERALFLHAAPRAYIASILAGENSVKELRILAPSRAARMAGRVQSLPEPRDDAALAAAAWACEMTSLEAAAQAMHGRHVAWVDFDVMLTGMDEALGTVAAALALPADAAAIEAIANGPLMRRYSKALEYEYSPALRRDLISEATIAHRSDIDRAMAMLDRAAVARRCLRARSVDHR